MKSARYFPTFWRNLLPSSGHHFPLERLSLKVIAMEVDVHIWLCLIYELWSCLIKCPQIVLDLFFKNLCAFAEVHEWTHNTVAMSPCPLTNHFLNYPLYINESWYWRSLLYWKLLWESSVLSVFFHWTPLYPKFKSNFINIQKNG